MGQDGETDLDLRVGRDPAYLGRKTGKFLPDRSRWQRIEVDQWSFWQTAGRPMAEQTHHFRNYAPEKIPYAIDRYVNETNRLYGVLNKRLADREFIAGDYSIADMASYPWVVPYKNQDQNIDDFPHLKRWLETMPRPARDRACLRQGEGGQSEFRPAGEPYRGGTQDPVRADGGGGAVGHVAHRDLRDRRASPRIYVPDTNTGGFARPIPDTYPKDA